MSLLLWFKHTIVAPPKPPLAQVSMGLINGRYTVLGKDSTGKTIASWSGTSQANAITTLNGFAARVK